MILGFLPYTGCPQKNTIGHLASITLEIVN